MRLQLPQNHLSGNLEEIYINWSCTVWALGNVTKILAHRLYQAPWQFTCFSETRLILTENSRFLDQNTRYLYKSLRMRELKSFFMQLQQNASPRIEWANSRVLWSIFVVKRPRIWDLVTTKTSFSRLTIFEIFSDCKNRRLYNSLRRH